MLWVINIQGGYKSLVPFKICGKEGMVFFVCNFIDGHAESWVCRFIRYVIWEIVMGLLRDRIDAHGGRILGYLGLRISQLMGRVTWNCERLGVGLIINYHLQAAHRLDPILHALDYNTAKFAVRNQPKHLPMLMYPLILSF